MRALQLTFRNNDENMGKGFEKALTMQQKLCLALPNVKKKNSTNTTFAFIMTRRSLKKLLHNYYSNCIFVQFNNCSLVQFNSSHAVGLIAQLVRALHQYRMVMGSNPIQARFFSLFVCLFFFFRFHFLNC